MERQIYDIAKLDDIISSVQKENIWMIWEFVGRIIETKALYHILNKRKMRKRRVVVLHCESKYWSSDLTFQTGFNKRVYLFTDCHIISKK